MKHSADYRFMWRSRAAIVACVGLTVLASMGGVSGQLRMRGSADSALEPAMAADEPSNPVVVRGRYVDDTHIMLTISDFCDLPAVELPFDEGVDYIGVWYEASEQPAAPDTTVASFVRFGLTELKAASGCPASTAIDTLIQVPELSAPDSVYHLRASVVWRNPTTIPPFDDANGDSVLMRDVTPPVNVCSIQGPYAGGRSDTAYLDIAGLDSREDDVEEVGALCSVDSAWGDTFFVRTLDVDSLFSSGTGDSLRLLVTSSAFDGARRTVYCAVVLVNDAGVPSLPTSGSFEVGRDLPPNPIELSAAAISSDAITLSWPFISVSGADSIRVFRDTTQIPLDIVNVVTPFDVVRVSPGATQTTVGDLSSSTTYFFAAQVRIYGDWTPVSLDSRAQARTHDPDPGDTITNTAVIDAASFDTVRNRILLSWHYGGAVDSTLQYGYVFGVDPVATAAGTPGTWYTVSTEDSAVIELGEDVLFDTTYTIAVKMRERGGAASRATADATASVRVNGYTWQPIEYFREQRGDTVWAFNNHVALWYEGTWVAGDIEDTVRAYHLSGTPRGMIPVGPSFMFSRYEHGPPLTLAVAYDSLPSGYRPDDIRLYRRTVEGQWMVFHEHALVAERGMVRVKIRMIDIDGQPIVPMIDREAPVTELRSDADTPVQPNTELYDTVAVSDNIGNLSVTLLYSRAGNPPSPGQLDTLRGQSAVITTAIPGGYVTEEDGVRAYVVVSDGLHRDTVNISRQVIRRHASDITTEPGTWVPLRTNAVLDDSTAASVIEGIAGDLGYDNTRCRIFRWFDPAAMTDDGYGGAHRWVEYDPAKEDVFALKPGKLMWIKTNELERLDFGQGVTVSLKEPVTIPLPPRNWTDMALPHKFGICLGDIIEATGDAAESLQYYRWNRGGDGTYVSNAMFIGSIPDSALNERSQVLVSGIQDGYSIYNPLDETVVLRVPPIAWSMSAYRDGRGGVAKGKCGHGSWSLRVEAGLEGAHRLGTVVLAYDPRSAPADKSWYPAAPSFGRVRVRAWDSSARIAYGHVVAHAMENGGVRYELLFENTAGHDAVVNWHIDGLSGLPDTMAVRVVDPDGGGEWPGDGTMRVRVPADGAVRRTVAVGGLSSLVDAYADIPPFAGFAAYPNPFTRGIAVRFLLPDGIGRLEYRLFDTRGRLVWKQNRTSGIGVGPNLAIWDGHTADARAAATGTYVLRVQAYDRRGSLLATREQRLVRMH